MTNLDTWVAEIGVWYKTRKHDQVSQLESLIQSVPEQVWGPNITDLQSKAIACWLDACLRVYNANQFQDPEKAFQYVQLAYSKFQSTACNPMADIELKDWCMKRMQHLTVLLLEFCNQQNQPQWTSQSHQLINSHVKFMSVMAWNNDQGSSCRSLH